MHTTHSNTQVKGRNTGMRTDDRGQAVESRGQEREEGKGMEGTRRMYL